MADIRKVQVRSPRRTLTAFLLALLAIVAVAPPALAQDPLGDFFGSLFGGSPQRARPAPPAQPRVRRMMPHQENRPPTYWRSGERSGAKRAAKRSEAGSAAGASQTPEPSSANYFVAVMGDTLGILLANGLEETFADKPEIGILKKAKENSGLVRDDFYDWPKAAREIAGGSQKIDVAVMMIGSNDRQTIRQSGQSDEALSPRWRETYAARVDAVLAAFREKKIPVVWVGLPIMKSESFSADMAKFNEIYRERVTRDGGVYVDLWEALADERGQFSAFGPDINGQIVKLRTADGVHFTEAGALSVAHFVANEIKKLYEMHHPSAPEQPSAAAPTADAPDLPPSQAAAPSAPPGAPVVFRSPVTPLAVPAPALPERPAIGPAQALGGPSASGGGGELARRAPVATPVSADSQALARHIFIEGGDQPPRANRADDSSWKPAAP